MEPVTIKMSPGDILWIIRAAEDIAKDPTACGDVVRSAPSRIAEIITDHFLDKYFPKDQS